MKIATAIEKMTDFYKGNIHDIYHFLKVWAFAKNIGEAEGLDPKTQETLEMAAVVHDIACPLCREKYGNTSGKHQERKVRRSLQNFSKMYRQENWMSNASHGWLRIIIPIQM